MDLTGWVIACVDGLRLVGLHHEANGSHESLSPVFEVRIDSHVLPVPGPGGKPTLAPMLARQLTPVFGCPSLTSYPIPADTRLIDLTTLSPEDQREFSKLIDDARETTAQRETQQRSGLVVP